MDPEIVKTATELAKATGAAAGLSIPFTAIVKRMLGPAADELAEMWRDQVRLYRYERQVKCVEKAEKMAKDAGFAPQAVPPKILFPLLEGASMEEDDDLHTMWAALLANAASPENAGKVRPGFIAILKQMAPDEAQLFYWLYDYQYGPNSDNHGTITMASVCKEFTLFGNLNRPASALRLHACFDGLIAQQFISPFYYLSRDELNNAETITVGVNHVFGLTVRAFAFLEACRPPKPKS